MQVCLTTTTPANQDGGVLQGDHLAQTTSGGPSGPYHFAIVSNYTPVAPGAPVPQAYIVSTSTATTHQQDIPLDHRNVDKHPLEGDMRAAPMAPPQGTNTLVIKQLQQTVDRRSKNAGTQQLMPQQIHIPVIADIDDVCKSNHVVSTSSSHGERYFSVGTEEEVEELILKHTESTFSHFVVAKKTKAYGSKGKLIDTTCKFRIHWQSRDLTSTEECAVQIPFQGDPFIYLGEKAYMCHLGRTKLKRSQHALHEVSNTTSADAEDDAHSLNQKKHRSKLTKKQGCPAKIFIKQIARFPNFKISSNTEYLRTQMSQKLRKAIMDSAGRLDYEIQYVGTLPDITQHKNHDIGENIVLKEPIDLIIRDRIVKLLWQHGENISSKDMKHLLESYVREVFLGRELPSRQRRRFFPSEKDISNYVYKLKMLSKLTKTEEESIHQTVEALRSQKPDSKLVIGIGIVEESPTAVTSPRGLIPDFHIDTETTDGCLHSALANGKQKFLFVYQSLEQQRLLKLYGKHVLLTEVSKQFPHSPYHTFCIYVPTNVGYQLVLVFLSQSPIYDHVRQALRYLSEWNPGWAPKFFTVDLSVEQLAVVEEMFPSCSVLVSDMCREEAWMNWLNQHKNAETFQGDKDIIFGKLSAIAGSFTEEALNVAAQNLENSQEWRLSESLRDWFTSQWLSEAKRWIAGYRQDDFINAPHGDTEMKKQLSNICESHFNLIRNKRISEYLTYIVTDLVPESEQSYIEKNIADYRVQYILRNFQDRFPFYLHNKSSAVISHILQKSKEAKEEEHSVDQVQSGIFWVISKGDPDTTFTVSFGSTTLLPSCICLDWLHHKLPCKHMMSVFNHFAGWDWNTMSPLYTSNPMFSIDTACFDAQQEDSIVSRWTKDMGIKFCCDRGFRLECARDGPHLKKPTGPPFATLLKTSSSSSTGSSVSADSLETDCNTFCRQLSDSIHRVDDHSVLQKLKVNLQSVLNDVTFELAKSNEMPSKRPASQCSVRSDELYTKSMKVERCSTVDSSMNSLTAISARGSPVESSSDSQKRDKADTIIFETAKKSSLVPSNAGVSQKVCSDEGGDLQCHENELKPLEKIGGSKQLVDSSDHSNERTNVWIYDSELDVQLLREDRKSILDGDCLSLKIIRTVQNILKHQFSDVDGFFDPYQIREKPGVETVSRGKCLQLHQLNDDHWSVSARTQQQVQIYCCTLSSKAKVIEQLMKISPMKRTSGLADAVRADVAAQEPDKLLFIERPEKEISAKNCCLYAIAYGVAFLFDIDARDLLFAECDMRAHLTECLEDMCFSMFPVLRDKRFQAHAHN